MAEAEAEVKVAVGVGEEIVYDEVDAYPPWNFSWVVENKLAVMAWPQTIQNLEFLHQEGIRHLVTLSPEKVPPMIEFPKLDWTQIPIDEYDTPSTKDIIKFIDVCQRCSLKDQAVGVHCRMGKGRSGVMAACYLVRFQELTPERALIDLNMERPGSVDSPEEERAVMRYHDCLRGIKSSEIQSVDDETEKFNLV